MNNNKQDDKQPQPEAQDHTTHMVTQLRNQRLLAIRRSRNYLFVCFLTFPVYVLALTRLLAAGNDTNVIMFAYMALYAWFGVRVVVQRCPDCHQQFFVKSFFLNPFRSNCAHCGQSLHPQG